MSIARPLAKSVASPIARAVTGASSGGAGWTPLEISANARIYLAEDATGSGSETLYTWNTIRDNRRWGDWIGRDSVFTYTDGGKLYMLGGWSNGNVTAWNSQFLTNELWESRDNGVTWSLILEDATSPTIQPTKRHLGARCYATFNGVDYVYLMGGKLDVSGGPQTPQTVDVWRKVLDGNPRTPWELVTSNAGVGARDNMFMGSLNGVLYAGGGYTGVGNTIGSGLGVQEDLWKSLDEGETWTLVTATAAWGPTAACGQELLEKDGKLWLFGGWEATTGFDAYTCRNDVWTYDGTSFVEVLADGHAQWARRFYHNVALMDGEFFIIGGHAVDSSNVTDNGYRSTDGVTWTVLPSKPYPNIHACSMWVVDDNKLIVQNGLIVPGGPFSIGVYQLHKLASVSRVSAWGDLTASSDARPYLSTGFVASGKKTVCFNGAQYMQLASQDDFSGAAAVMIAGYFPHFTTTNQSVVASATGLSLGVNGIGTYAMDSSSDNAMERFHPNKMQREYLRTIVFSMDGSELTQWVDGEAVECDGETFTLSGWSRIGGGHTVTAENLKGHIVAIAVIPDSAVTQEQVDSFQSYARTKSGVAATTDPIGTIAPDPLLLCDKSKSHHAPTKHLLKD